MAENNHPPEGNKEAPKEEPKKSGTLESLIGECKSFLKKGIFAATAIGVPFVFSIPNTPVYDPTHQMSINAAVTAHPLAVGAALDDIMARQPINYKKMARESAVGTIMMTPLVGLFDKINVGRDYAAQRYGSLAGSATAVGSLAAGQAVFVGGYMGLDHTLSKFSFSGLYDRLKKDYWPTLRRTFLCVLPLSMWNPLYVYKFGMLAQLGYSSLMTLLFRLVGPKSEGAKLSNLFKAPFGYVSASFSLAKRAAKNAVSYTSSESMYKLGGGMREFFSSFMPKAKPAAKQPEQPKAEQHYQPMEHK